MRVPDGFIFWIGFSLVVLIGLIDYFTGPFFILSLLYLLPVLSVAWATGLASGIILSIVSVIVWLAADIALREFQLHPVISIFNALLRLAVLLLIVYGVGAVRAARESVEDLIHFIVHDLRTPLASIALSLDSLGKAGPLNDRQARTVSRAKVSLGRMSHLINSILDLRRLEKGAFKPQAAWTGIGGLVRDSLREVTPLAQSRAVNLQSSLNKAPETVCTDAELVRRVLVNLLVNAVKVSPGNSTVFLSVEHSDGLVAFRVRDSGPGIPRAKLPLLFNKYAQLRSRGSGAFRGSGLGLSFCKYAVNELGGHIAIESEENKGTQVEVLLPRECVRGNRRSRR